MAFGHHLLHAGFNGGKKMIVDSVLVEVGSRTNSIG
jgi:hypothetical protein